MWSSASSAQKQVIAMARLCSRLASAAIALAAALALCACAASDQDRPDVSRLEVSDAPYTWVFNYNEDMQLPELPTGCEATAAATMMRMSGELVTKQDVADRMRKSDEDFVHSFLGDPYSTTGWACMAPCVTETLNSFLDVEEKHAAVELTGTPIEELPTPCCIWVTIDMVDAGEPVLEKEGYGLHRNSHCVVLLGIEKGIAYVVDPLVGKTEYTLASLQAAYDGMGQQAVYLATIDEAVRLINERGVG